MQRVSADFADFSPYTAAGTEEQLLEELRTALAPRIQVTSRIGRGGMAAVFLGRDPMLKRSIAIKVMLPNIAGSEAARLRFSREAQAVAAIAHPHVAGVFDVGQLPSGLPYFLMQFVEGVSLDDVMNADGLFPEARARRVMGEIASALGAAHARDIVHRDVKPSNVIIEAESRRAVVVDFGISAAVGGSTRAADASLAGDASITQVGTYVGTPRYTSPEQAAGEKVSGKSDVYSLGVLVFETLTGRAPFEDTTPMSLLAAHMKASPPSVRSLRPDLDPSFTALVDRCLVKDPASRPSAEEIAKFLMPEPQAAIEWPPPGLEDLHGRGASLASAFNWFGAIATVLIVGLATQPTLGTARWTEFEGSLIWSMVGNLGAGSGMGDTPDATQAWLFALAGLFAATTMAFVICATRLIGAVRSISHGRRQGYPLDVVALTALDNHDDTSALFSRSGRFAVLNQREQRRIHLARALRVAAMPAAFLASALFMILWFAGAGAGSIRIVLFDAPQAMAVLLPVFAGAALLMYSLVLEVPARRALLGLPAPRRVSRREFVRDWLVRFPPTASTRFAPVVFLIPALGVLVGLASVLVLFLTGLSMGIAARNVWHTRGQYLGLSPSSWNSERHSDYRKDDLSGPQLIKLLDTLRVVPRKRTSDTVAARQLAIAAFALADSARAHFANWSELFSISGLDRTLPASRSRTVAASPVLPVLRAFARSTHQPLPLTWFDEQLLRQHRGGALRPAPFVLPGLEAAIAQGILDMNARNYPAVRDNVADLLAVAARLLRCPLRQEHERAVDYAAPGQFLMSDLARETADVRLATAAGRIRQLAEALEIERYSPARQQRLNLLWSYAGNVADNGDAPDMVGDDDLLPYERWHVVSSLVTAYCLSAREIVFGVSPRRVQLIEAAARYEPEIARTAEWTRINADIARRWIDDPAAEYARVARTGGSVLDVLKWIGMRDFHARLRFCAANPMDVS